jgi:hypothetical protein
VKQVNGTKKIESQAVRSVSEPHIFAAAALARTSLKQKAAVKNPPAQERASTDAPLLGCFIFTTHAAVTKVSGSNAAGCSC